MAFIGALVWLFMMVLWIWIITYCLWQCLKWTFRKLLGFPDKQARIPEFHLAIVRKAEKTRLTREETARRVFALYPVREVSRVPWPTSYGRH